MVQWRVMPTVSHSWNASEPIRWVGTWPVMQTSGIEIHHRVGEAGHGIGRAGPGGNQHDADLAGRARVTFRRMSRALLVAHEDVLDLILMEDRVVDRQDGAARIAEYDVDALILQGLDHHFGTAQLLHHGPSPSREFEQQKRPG